MNIAIIGGGQTAAYAAKEIRENDLNCKITIFSEENFLPYEKPPLSKEYLKNNKEFESLLFFSEEFYDEKKIMFEKNTKIVDVDFENKLILSESNQKFNYDKLLLANGAVNRKVDITELNNDNDVIYLRNKKECDSLKNKIKFAKNILIIGGGFIGLEVAASIKSENNKIHLIEMNKSLMGRIIPKVISNNVKKIHEDNGNKIYLNTTIKKIVKKDSCYEILLSDSNEIKVDLIVIGIGSIPNTDIFKKTNLKINNGIETNNYCETSIKDVYAAGDIANFFHPFYNKNIRLESYSHAQNHGICAGKNMTGVKTSYEEIPWMWSDQFEYNIQLTGMCDEYDTMIQRGDNLDEGIVLFFVKKGIIKGACGIGKMGKIGRDIRLASRISNKKIVIDRKQIEDKNFKLNKLLR